METLSTLFSNNGFMPHGHCFLWVPSILWTTVISDALITMAYMTIPVTLVYFILKRRDIPFDWVFVAFGVFILACGGTHVLDIWTVWNPDYGLLATMKAITAIASVITAGALVRLIPLALAIPSPSQLEKLNRKLQESNAESRIAMEKAEVANRAKSAFLAAMSHELRTPLNAVLGYSQILRRDKTLTDRQLLAMSTIQQSGQHLLTLINDVLDLSKIEAGKIELHKAAAGLPGFLAVIADIIRVRAEKGGLTFRLDIETELPTAVVIDETRLRQVLLNLCGNAVKFTERGSVTLRVTQIGMAKNGIADAATSTREHQICLRFEVIDTGVGIAPEQQQTVFLPFEQAGGISRRKGGTGLGLAISRQLVHLMGSEISLESKPGQGSRFWFDLNLTLAEAPFAADRPEQIATGYDGPRKTVLVVDDVRANRALLMDLLGTLGFDLHEAEDGEVALQMVAIHKPDIVVMDLVMPNMDGIEATKRLRALEETASLPIIIVSASATLEDEETALAVGADAFVTKPIEERELLGQIGALLKIEWRSEPVSKQPLAVEGTLVPPPAAELAALHHLALAGKLGELRRRAAQIVNLDICYQPFVNKLDQLAANFESKAVLSLVESHLDSAAKG